MQMLLHDVLESYRHMRGIFMQFCHLATVLYARFKVRVPAITLKRKDKLQEYDKTVLNKTRGYNGMSKDIMLNSCLHFISILYLGSRVHCAERVGS